jgi:hypothetical protein
VEDRTLPLINPTTCFRCNLNAANMFALNCICDNVLSIINNCNFFNYIYITGEAYFYFAAQNLLNLQQRKRGIAGAQCII